MSLSPLIGLIAASIFTPSGIQYVGGMEVNASGWSTTPPPVSMSGALTGGIASSPEAGDFCIVCYSQAGTADRSNRSISNAAGEFTLLETSYVSDTNDVSITVKYKFLESPIDYTLLFGSPSSSSNGVNVSIQVFRGVNVTTPFDVTHLIDYGTSTVLPDPGSITPVTSGAVIGIFASGGMGVSISSTFTSSDYDNFTATTRSAASRSLATAFGRKAWVSGTFNASTFGGIAVNAADSNLSVTFALRPA